MSDQPETYSEDIDDRAYDPEQAAEAEVNLDQPEFTDDVPWSPPEQKPPGLALDNDAGEEETIEQRISQEVPEEGTAYGAPEAGGMLDGPDNPENADMAGGDDPDAIPAEEDFQG